MTATAMSCGRSAAHGKAAVAVDSPSHRLGTSVTDWQSRGQVSGVAALALSVLEAGSRKRNQPAPPHVIYEALTQPDRDPVRPWLLLLDDEERPRTLEVRKPHLVVWSSIWTKRPDAQVRFDLPFDGTAGTDLRWTLLLADPLPEPSLLGHMRKRLNQLINANLRYTFGQ
jgi:hypothetical protein